MASSKKTKNIKLNDYALIDIPVMGDVNEDNRILDEIIASLKDRLSLLENEKFNEIKINASAIASLKDSYDKINDILATADLSNIDDNPTITNINQLLDEYGKKIKELSDKANETTESNNERLAELENTVKIQSIKDVTYDSDVITLAYHNKADTVDINLDRPITETEVKPHIIKVVNDNFKDKTNNKSALWNTDEIKQLFTDRPTTASVTQLINNRVGAIPRASADTPGLITLNDVVNKTKELVNQDDTINTHIEAKIEDALTSAKVKSLIEENTADFNGLTKIASDVDKKIKDNTNTLMNTINKNYNTNSPEGEKILWSPAEIKSVITDTVSTIPDATETIKGIITKNEIQNIARTESENATRNIPMTSITGLNKKLSDVDKKISDAVSNSVANTDNADTLIENASSAGESLEEVKDTFSGAYDKNNPEMIKKHVWSANEIINLVKNVGQHDPTKLSNLLNQGEYNNYSLRLWSESSLMDWLTKSKYHRTLSGRLELDKLLLGKEYSTYISTAYDGTDRDEVIKIEYVPERYNKFNIEDFDGITYRGKTKNDIPDYPNVQNYIRDNYIGELQYTDWQPNFGSEETQDKYNLSQYLHGERTTGDQPLTLNNNILIAKQENVKAYAQPFKPQVVFTQMFMQMRYSANPVADDSLELKLFSPYDINNMIDVRSRNALDTTKADILRENNQAVNRALGEKANEINTSLETKLNQLKDTVKTEVAQGVDSVVKAKIKEFNDNSTDTINDLIDAKKPNEMSYNYFTNNTDDGSHMRLDGNYNDFSVIQPSTLKYILRTALEYGKPAGTNNGAVISDTSLSNFFTLRYLSADTDENAYGVINFKLIKNIINSNNTTVKGEISSVIDNKLSPLRTDINAKLNKNELNEKVNQLLATGGYLKKHQNLDHKLDKLVYDREKVNFLTAHQDISGKLNITDLSTKVDEILATKGYLTQHQSLDHLLSKNEFNTAKTDFLTVNNFNVEKNKFLTKEAFNNEKNDLVTKTEYNRDKANFATNDDLATVRNNSVPINTYNTDKATFLTKDAFNTEKDALVSKNAYDTDKATYVTKNELAGKGYLTGTDIADKVDANEVTRLIQRELDDRDLVSSSDASAKLNKADLTPEVNKILDTKGYLTNNALDDYATTNHVNTEIGKVKTSLNDYTPLSKLGDYVSKTELAGKGYLTNDDLNNYVTNETLTNKNYATKAELNNYVTTTSAANYVTSDQITDVVRTNQIANLVNNTTLNNYVEKSAYNSKVGELSASYKNVMLVGDTLRFTTINGNDKEIDLSKYNTPPIFSSIRFDNDTNELVFNDGRTDTKIALSKFLDHVETPDATDTIKGKVTLQQIKDLISNDTKVAGITNLVNGVKDEINRNLTTNYLTSSQIGQQYYNKNNMDTKLNDYATKASVTQSLNPINSTIGELRTSLNNKVNSTDLKLSSEEQTKLKTLINSTTDGANLGEIADKLQTLEEGLETANTTLAGKVDTNTVTTMLGNYVTTDALNRKGYLSAGTIQSQYVSKTDYEQDKATFAKRTDLNQLINRRELGDYVSNTTLSGMYKTINDNTGKTDETYGLFKPKEIHTLIKSYTDKAVASAGGVTNVVWHEQSFVNTPTGSVTYTVNGKEFGIDVYKGANNKQEYRFKIYQDSIYEVETVPFVQTAPKAEIKISKGVGNDGQDGNDVTYKNVKNIDLTPNIVGIALHHSDIINKYALKSEISSLRTKVTAIEVNSLIDQKIEAITRSYLENNSTLDDNTYSTWTKNEINGIVDEEVRSSISSMNADNDNKYLKKTDYHPVTLPSNINALSIHVDESKMNTGDSNWGLVNGANIKSYVNNRINSSLSPISTYLAPYLNKPLVKTEDFNNLLTTRLNSLLNSTTTPNTNKPIYDKTAINAMIDDKIRAIPSGDYVTNTNLTTRLDNYVSKENVQDEVMKMISNPLLRAFMYNNNTQWNKIKISEDDKIDFQSLLRDFSNGAGTEVVNMVGNLRGTGADISDHLSHLANAKIEAISLGDTKLISAIYNKDNQPGVDYNHLYTTNIVNTLSNKQAQWTRLLNEHDLTDIYQRIQAAGSSSEVAGKVTNIERELTDAKRILSTTAKRMLSTNEIYNISNDSITTTLNELNRSMQTYDGMELFFIELNDRIQ